MKPFCVILAFATCLSLTFIASAQEKETAKLKTDLQTLVEGNNEFAFDLYHKLAEKEGNLFFSPYSISSALGMTYAGARGNTAKEMAQTLHFTLENDKLHSAFGQLIRKINGTEGKKRLFQLQVANALWADKNDFEPDPKFLRTTRTDYHAAFELVDFLKNSEGSRHRINGWVEEQTKKKIVDLIPSGGITEETRLLIVNAIYFKGDWSLPFPKSATKPDDFTMSGESAFKVPMMNRSYFASYFGDVFGDFRLAQLSYKGDEVSMIVVLPVAIDGLAKVEQNLSAKALEQALARAKPAPLQVSLPKFKLSEQFNVSSELNSLGMRDAFDKKVSDFTGMEIQKAGRKQSLHISDVVHKAIVDVAEESTEAAAATALIIPAPISIDAPPPPPIVPFLADHPFLIFVRHNPTGTILFICTFRNNLSFPDYSAPNFGAETC